MSTLKEFLHDEAVRIREEAPKREAIRREWDSALKALYSQICSWLSEADKDRILKVEDFPELIVEAGMGNYVVHGLQIGLDDRQVRFVPRARRALVPQRVESVAKGSVNGRVDLMDGPVAIRVLYLVSDAQGDRWIATGPVGGTPAPFDRKELESALLSALK